MEEYKIGEMFDYDDVKLIVIPASNYNCAGCYFKRDKRCFTESMVIKCNHFFRKDKKDVIFKEIK